jgi:site-specific recombinase XerD
MSKFALYSLPRTARDWLIDSPLRRHAYLYARSLRDEGYAAGTVYVYLGSVAHFAHWMSKRHVPLHEIDERLAGVFLDRHLPACRCAGRCQRTRHTVHAALLRLIELLRVQGHLAPKRSVDPAAIQIELQCFDTYLVDVCGLMPITRYYRMCHLRRFLLDQFKQGPVLLCQVHRSDVVRFLTRYTLHWAARSKAVVYGVLRSYFRFKALQGEPTTDLLAAFPRTARWRLARLPQVASIQEIRRLFDAFDRSSAIGLRDYAIARCLVDLGLRAAEVARLRLDDFDWRSGTVQIRGKGQRCDLMPLPTQTGRAIAQYLREGRPANSHRMVFARHRGPLNAPMTAYTVRRIIRDTAARAGLSALTHGPHLLRHTAAQRLIHGGATLKNVADFLRHRSLDTTTIYTKIDLLSLRRVALPWPGRRV